MIKIRIRCTSSEKVLSRLVLSNIEFYHPEKKDGELALQVSVFSFLSAIRFLRSNGMKYKAYPMGTLALLWRYRKRWGLLAGTIISIFLFYLSTFYVWSVKIEGNSRVGDREVIETLYKNGFYEGVRRDSVDVNEVALGFLSDRSEFSFCTININGTVAHVELVERTPARFSESEHDPYNLVSDSDGVVVRVEILNGQSMVRVGDSVHKGQILASGVIENTVNTAFRLRRAEGKVFARCEKTVDFSVPLKMSERVYTHEKTYSRLYFLGRGFGWRDLEHEGEYDVITSVEKISFLGREFPVGIEKTLCAFSETRNRELSEQEALVRAHGLYRAWCSTELEGAVVESEVFSHAVENGTLTLSCTVVAIEDITSRQKIEIY